MKYIVFDHQIFSLQQFGGISRYFCELASRVDGSGDFLARIAAPVHYNDYLAACDASVYGVYLPMKIPRSGRAYRAVARSLSPVAICAARPSIVHRTYFGRSFAPAGVPTVVTVYDMIHELFPENFLSSDTTSRDKRRSVEVADLVVCISHSTAEDLIRIFSVPREKVRVVHLGFSDVFSRTGAERLAAKSRPYLLYVGHRAGYKNFAGFLRAYAGNPRLRSLFDIVVFGGSDFTSEERRLIGDVGVRGDAVRRVTGSDGELARAYANAHLFVYPSKYEGFGIPPLEAMAAECPVACSNVSSIPEVVGDAAELFDPDSDQSIAAAIERVCFDDARRDELIGAGRRRLQMFSWDRCARETLDAYREVVG